MNKNYEVNSKKRTNRGITLIALVITIIVLLILAGISIATLTGQNGILTKSDTAREETRGGAVEEAKNLWKTNQKIDKYGGNSSAQTLDEILSDLKQQELLTEEEVTTIKETGKVTIGSREIVFFEQIEKLQRYVLVYRESLGKLEIDIDQGFLLYCFLGIEDLTDEELYAKADILNSGVEMTFEEIIEMLYEEKKISQKYKTLRELFDGTDGYGGFANYEEFLSAIKEVLIRNLSNDNTIEIFNPDGTKYDYGYLVPCQEGEYIFTAKIGEEEFQFKIAISQYEMVEVYNNGSKGYALDVRNKKYLLIKSAKIEGLSGGRGGLDEYLISEDSHCYLDMEAAYNYIINHAVSRKRDPYRFRTIFVCEEGIIEGFLFY